VRKLFSEELLRVSYHTKIIHLSQELGVIFDDPRLTTKQECAEDVRINTAMNYGNIYRKQHTHNAAVAYLGIYRIKRLRRQRPFGDGFGTAYIFSSLKTPVEITSLRAIYGDFLYVVSVYSPRQQRLNRLTENIATSRRISDRAKFRSSAEELIERDLSEPENPYGQNLQETFPSADVFFRMADKESLRKDIRRYVELMFGHPFITPTKDEQGMFLARAASLRSADLSRQVGSAITTFDGDVISIGCNEVPSPRGGLYWEDDADPTLDFRDFRLGYDTNSRKKTELVGEIFKALREAKWLDDKEGSRPIKFLISKALDERRGVLKNAQITNIIEYGRIVHAEMNALAEAAKKGVAVRGSQMYCTTFPCHICARHILAAGVRRVVYIEPYPKSLAIDLYDRMIQADEGPAHKDAVRFDPFVGVAPRRYAELFEIRSRKKQKDGSIVPWEASISTLKVMQTNVEGFEYMPPLFGGYIEGEQAALKMLSGDVAVRRVGKAKP
jgi:cytidine deaminase